MDRNLGAPDVNYHGNSTGSVYYQFGRKDPFEGGSLYKPDGSSISISTIAWNSSIITQESSKIGKNVPYSIQNPLKYITGTVWTTGDQYCPANGGDFMWQDPKSAPSADGKVKKSIFDPCPSGWMVPVNGAFNGVSAIQSSTLANGIGYYYHPTGTGTTNIYVFFPACGFRTGNGSFERVSDYYILPSWSCSSSGIYGFSMRFYNGSPISSSSDARACGYPVRCVQEYF